MAIRTRIQKTLKTLKKYIWDIILSVSIGYVSYFIIIYFANDFLVKDQDKLLTFNALVWVAIVFTCLGFIISYCNTKIVKFYYYLKNSHILISALFISSIILGISNYLLFVSLKFIVGIEHPFALHGQGFTILFIIWLIELLITREVILNHLYTETLELYKQSKDYKEQSIKANYTALQNQLNPHFLFNSLNTLISEIEYNPDVAVAFTRNLADVYRYILFCQNRDTITLKEELEFMNKYIMLHQVRLGDCIKVDNQINEAYSDIAIPPLTLQLLTENIIKHNAIYSTKPMTIHLYCEMEEKVVWLCVRNHKRVKKGVTSSGKGLNNLNQRFQLLYETSIKIEDTDKDFIVKVPLIYD